MPAKLFNIASPRTTPAVHEQLGLFSIWFGRSLERLSSTEEQTALTTAVILHCAAALKKTELQEAPLFIPPAAA
jgi:hypothetical protein